MMANFTFCLSLVFLLLGGGFPLGVDATTYRLNATGSPQYFTSRNYPSNYLDNTNDDWVIYSGSSVYRVRITVVDSTLQYSSNCRDDHFYFTNGLPSDAHSTVLGHCGSWNNCYFESSGQYATISLRTNGITTNKGFRMSYHRVTGNASIVLSSCTASGARPSASVPVGWRVGCTLVVLVSFGLVGWEGFYV